MNKIFKAEYMEIIGYINEQKFVYFIHEMIKHLSVESNAFKFLGSQMRFDDNKRFAFDCGFIFNDKKYLVEFDGYRHYTDALAMYRDNQKDIIAERNGFTLVRFPYWLQLNTETFNLLFGQRTEFRIITTYPYGFISDKAVLPCNYCCYGYKRFLNEFDKLPKSIQDEITCSLIYQSNKKELPIKYIFPDCDNFPIKVSDYICEINFINGYPYKELY
jgi:hypothetical protein